MTADQPAPGPAPRRLLDDAPGPAEVTAAPEAPGPPDSVAADGKSVATTSAADIATLETPPPTVIGVADDPRTGEPRRPVAVRIATVACWLAVAVIGVSLLWIYWDSVPPENFAGASWLMGQFPSAPGSLERVLLAVAVTTIGLIIATTNAIVGYYAWTGYRWTRIAGLISAGLSFGALVLNPVAWAAIPLAVVGAGLLWLPIAGRFFTAWQARRHPAQVFSPPVTDVYYGPLPRYR